jgi:single-stranded-DNA-specific exonuclease
MLSQPPASDLMDRPAFLGVTASLTGRQWQARTYDARVAEALQQRFALPELLARSMAGRGVSLEQAVDYLEPTLRALMPNPSVFQGMEPAVTRLVQAIKQQESITVFGDYDVDGGTSSALVLRFLRHCGLQAALYIPDRIAEGYGPNPVAMERIAAQGSSLVICVDCGTTAHVPLQRARDLGLAVIVLDHHTAEPSLPPCVALVNPNRLDDTSGQGHLCAAGVTYLFIVAVNRALRSAGFYAASITEPDLLQWLDLVALGTVADVVPLVGLNRAFVSQGLRILSRTCNAGLAALMQVGRATMPPDAFTAGFILGPRVNAGGRIGQSDLGARLLACDDEGEAMALAIQLDQHNAERREVEADVLAAAEYQAQQQGDAPFLLIAGEGWHPGVIGIVASRLKDRYHRPTFVIGLDGDMGKGSGRSIRGLDLGAMVIAARQAGLLINGGGHAMAAGLTVARDMVNPLRQFMQERTAHYLAASPIVPSVTLDGLVSGAAATPDFIDQLERLKPFGTGNPEPRFVLPACKIVRADVVGQNHVRVIFTCGGARVTGIAFRVLDQALGAALLQSKGQALHLAGYLRPDNWNGRNGVQLQIDDAAFVHE